MPMSAELKPIKRINAIVVRDKLGGQMLGRSARLVIAGTGQEIQCVRDISLHLPLDGIVTATVELVINDVEIRESTELPVEKHEGR